MSFQPPASATSLRDKCFRSVAHFRRYGCQRPPLSLGNFAFRSATVSHLSNKCLSMGSVDPPQRLTDSTDAIAIYAFGECADAINNCTIDCKPILRSVQYYIDRDKNAGLLRSVLDDFNQQLARFGYSWSLTNSFMGNCLAAIRLAPERPIMVQNQQVSGRCVEMNDGSLVWWVGQALQHE